MDHILNNLKRYEIMEYNEVGINQGSTLLQWLALLPHSKQVLSLNLPSGQGFSVSSLHVLSVFARVLSKYSGFLPKSKDVGLG